ncbi:MAG: leucine-rich repeat domain-containing protein [Polyangiaceae bacterium]
MKRMSSGAVEVGFGTFGTWALVVLGAALGTLGCDEEKKNVEPPMRPAVTASGTASATPPVVSAAAVPSAAPKAPAKPCTADGVVVFDTGSGAPNKALEEDTRKKLSKPSGDVTVADLKNVKSLNLAQAETNALDGCLMPLYGNLKDLFLGRGELYDLGPISGLTELLSLRVAATRVTDLKPLARLGKLDRLDLAKTPVKNLEPLSGLTNLTELTLDETAIDDLTPLSSLVKLERLSLKNTTVKDLGPLKGMTKLRFLYLAGSAVGDISPIQPLVAKGLKIDK